MNTKLILRLSLFGLAMAYATVRLIPSGIEPFFWLVIFIICAYLVARNCLSKYFLHGFLISLLNSVWVTAIHITLRHTYLANHPAEMQMLASGPLATHPRLMMLITGPVIGVLSGLILGLFCFLASKFIKPKLATPGE